MPRRLGAPYKDSMDNLPSTDDLKARCAALQARVLSLRGRL